jgi:hypothetical protein
MAAKRHRRVPSLPAHIIFENSTAKKSERSVETRGKPLVNAKILEPKTPPRLQSEDQLGKLDRQKLTELSMKKQETRQETAVDTIFYKHHATPISGRPTKSFVLSLSKALKQPLTPLRRSFLKRHSENDSGNLKPLCSTCSLYMPDLESTATADGVHTSQRHFWSQKKVRHRQSPAKDDRTLLPDAEQTDFTTPKLMSPERVMNRKNDDNLLVLLFKYLYPSVRDNFNGRGWAFVVVMIAMALLPGLTLWIIALASTLQILKLGLASFHNAELQKVVVSLLEKFIRLARHRWVKFTRGSGRKLDLAMAAVTASLLLQSREKHPKNKRKSKV